MLYLFAEHEVYRHYKQHRKSAGNEIIVPAYRLSVHDRVDRCVGYQQSVQHNAERHAERKTEYRQDDIFTVDVVIHFSVRKAEHLKCCKLAVAFYDVDV